jgi:hypothetical protein
MIVVKMGMEPAVVNELTRVVEAQDKLSGFAPITISSGQKHIGSIVTGSVKEIVANDCVIVGISIDPFNSIAPTYGNAEGRESILSGNDHLLKRAMTIVGPLWLGN